MSKRILVEISMHLPLYHNPDPQTGKRRRIERARFEETYREVLERFEGYSLFRDVEGVWISPEGEVFIDRHNVVFILTEDNPKTQQWLREYKRKLEERFEQKEIFIKIAQVRRI